jgi:hypothetical protein
MPKKLTEATNPDPYCDPDDPGFVGVATDPTPNEAYTLAGVLAQQPTPETDADAAEAARQALAN